ncbi:MAG: serine/threonine-protein kinase [Deltaproteobacteria bacterium]|nr:serine/threonine-protein kinase [Deltaproteobacteria bacterium]
MSHPRWQEIWDLFESTIDRPPQERTQFLADACAGDQNLLRGVEELLAADAQEEAFFEAPLARGPRLEQPLRGPLREPLREPLRGIEPGVEIGAYRILRRLGQGGMSIVYLAVRSDDAFERNVVLKFVRPDMETEAILERLRTERQILASLEHPGIARLYDGGSTESGLPYFVMEYVEGEPIDQWCQHHQPTVQELFTLLIKVCAAVDHAHRNLVVHSDLKPSNILVTAQGEPKLLDFGIAKLLQPRLSSAGLEPTATLERLFTPSYASPEQLRGGPISTASDVYSLGVLTYRLLTGSLPFSFAGLSPLEIERLLLETEPPRPSVVVARPVNSKTAANSLSLPESRNLAKELQGDIDAIVLKALGSSPRQRYGSVEHLAADFERYQARLPVAAHSMSWRYRLGKFVRRRRRAVVAGLAVAVLIVGFEAAMTVQAKRVANQRDQALLERDKKAQVLSLVLELFRFSSPYSLPGEELTVREALERSVPILEASLIDHPEVRAELLHTSGSIFQELGHPERARHQLGEALSLRRQALGDRHPDVAETRGALASALKELGDLDQAEKEARLAVAELRRRLDSSLEPSTTSKLVEALNHLVSVLCYRDEFDAAEGPAAEALALTHQLPPGSSQRIAALEQLARLRSATGDYEQAARLNRSALRLRRNRFGKSHPGLVTPLNNLGTSLRRLGDLEAAERALAEAIGLREANFGQQNADPYLLSNLASLRFDRGNFAGAETLFQQAGDLQRGLDPPHWLVFVFDLQVARTWAFQGAPERAEERIHQLLEEWQPRLGDHWRIADAQGLLGESISLQGRCQVADPLLVHSFEASLERAKSRSQLNALTRLRGHLERCGRAEEISHFEALLPR